MPLIFVTYLLWLVLIVACGWIAFPLSRRLFPNFLDGGLAVGRVIFLGTWGLCAFWTGIAHLPPMLAVWLLVPATGASLFFWKRDWKALYAEIQRRQKALWALEITLLIVFSLGYGLRGYWSDTDGNNGEKSMDSALIGTLLRADRLPPPNPYAAGARLQSYYYFGHLETALLTKATFTTGRWSYNLMCATLPALAVTVLFSLGAAMTGRLTGGGFVSATVLGLGTLQPLYQWKYPDAYSATRFLHLDAFAISRVIPYTINEFPFFTFNQADLHAHYLDFQFELVMMALAWALFMARGKRKFALAGVAAFVAGAQIMTNTWDFPAYMLLVGLALLWGVVAPGAAAPQVVEPIASSEEDSSTKRTQRKEKLSKSQKQLEAERNAQRVANEQHQELLQRFPFFSNPHIRVGLAFAIAVVAVSLAAPFLMGIRTAATHPTRLQQPASPLREWLMLWGPIALSWWSFSYFITFKEKPLARQTLIGIGLFVLVCAAWPARIIAPIGFLDYLHGVWGNPSPLIIPLILASMTLCVVGMFNNRGAARFACLLAFCGLVALLWSETTWAGFLGSADHLGADDYKRQDTVFKFGMQTWMLWGTATATGVWLTLKRHRNWYAPLWIPMIAVMLIGNFCFVFFRTHGFDKSQAQLWDGWAHMAPPEKQAGEWLEANIPHGSAILEAEQKEGGDYTNYTRYADATGIPTLIGPQSHSFQWSPANTGDGGKEWDAVFKRKELARTAFTTPDDGLRRKILNDYGIKAVVWGELERIQYGTQAEANLTRCFGEPVRFGESTDPHLVLIFKVEQK